MSRVKIIPKLELAHEQLQKADTRIFAAEHRDEVGPYSFWNNPGFEPKYLAAFDATTDEFVGTVYGRIAPPLYGEVAWWIDSIKRNEKYGYDLMDALVDYLKAREVTTLGTIVFRGNFEIASRKLAAYLKARME